jgi:hypothetical protein
VRSATGDDRNVGVRCNQQTESERLDGLLRLALEPRPGFNLSKLYDLVRAWLTPPQRP